MSEVGVSSERRVIRVLIVILPAAMYAMSCIVTNLLVWPNNLAIASTSLNAPLLECNVPVHPGKPSHVHCRDLQYRHNICTNKSTLD